MCSIPQIEEIQEALQAAAKEVRDHRTNTPWTRAVMQSMSAMGRNNGWWVATKDCDLADHKGNWLFDLCWYDAEPDGQLLALGLALECEWGKTWDDIIYDFEKLLVADAPLKVMIFEAVEAREQLFVKLCARIKAYRGNKAGQTYLFACFNGGEEHRNFEFDTWHLSDADTCA